jgi:hypothetical protein
MALPVFNEGTMRYHDSESNKMMKTSVAESILAASKPALTAESTALATVSPVSTQMSAVDPTPMSPMESTMAIFQSMADSLMNIESLLLEQNTLQEDQTALEMRDESISDADVIDMPSNPPGPEEKKGPGRIRRGLGKMGSMFSMGGLLKTGLIVALTGIMAFADEFAELLQPVLKFIKEKAWPNAVDIFTDFMEKGRQLFGGLADKLSIIFGDSGGPHGVTLMDRVKAFAGIFTDLGGFILGIGNSIITNVLEMFGVNFDPYDSAGAWMLGKLEEMWDGLKGWFTGLAAKWPLLGDIGTWVLEKATAAFQGIKDFFGGAIEAFKVDGFAGVYDYVKDKVLSAFQGPIDFFSGAIEAFKLGSENGEGGFATLGAWLKDKLQSPFNFLKDLFSFPEKPEEGFFSFEFGGKVMAKFLDLVFLPLNLAINFLKDIFGFSKDDAEKDEDYEPFSVGKTIVDLYSKMWDWLADKFTFDPSSITGKVLDFGSFMKAISIASGAYLKTLLNPFTEGSNLEAAKAAYGATMTEYGFGDTGGSAQMQAEPNPSTAALASQTAMMDASGAGVAVYDYSNNTSTSSTSQDTYTATELATDHGDQSGSWFSRIDWTPWN